MVSIPRVLTYLLVLGIILVTNYYDQREDADFIGREEKKEDAKREAQNIRYIPLDLLKFRANHKTKHTVSSRLQAGAQRALGPVRSMVLVRGQLSCRLARVRRLRR